VGASTSTQCVCGCVDCGLWIHAGSSCVCACVCLRASAAADSVAVAVAGRAVGIPVWKAWGKGRQQGGLESWSEELGRLEGEGVGNAPSDQMGNYDVMPAEVRQAKSKNPIPKSTIVRTEHGQQPLDLETSVYRLFGTQTTTPLCYRWLQRQTDLTELGAGKMQTRSRVEARSHHGDHALQGLCCGVREPA